LHWQSGTIRVDLPFGLKPPARGAVLMEDFFIERQDGPVTFIQFVNESLMNTQEIERISQSLCNKIDVDLHHQLVLDFVRVRYLSSSAIGMLLSLKKKVSKVAGGKLILVGVGPELLQLLKIANLHKVLTINPA
jgi:anti-anti-sigma factor